MWKYKGIKINISKEGIFTFVFQGNTYTSSTLAESKRYIDELISVVWFFDKEELEPVLLSLNATCRKIIKDRLKDMKDYEIKVTFQIVNNL